MEVYFKSNRLMKKCSSQKEADREWGSQNGKLVTRRLAELLAADSLSDISCFPPTRLHQLYNNRAGQFAIDVKHPFRLILTPEHNPVPLLPDGGIDLTKVTKVKIIEIGDYHGD